MDFSPGVEAINMAQKHYSAVSMVLTRIDIEIGGEWTSGSVRCKCRTLHRITERNQAVEYACTFAQAYAEMCGIVREHDQENKVLAPLCGTAGERSRGNEVQLQRNETRAARA